MSAKITIFTARKIVTMNGYLPEARAVARALEEVVRRQRGSMVPV